MIHLPETSSLAAPLYQVRGRQIILDNDLAALFGVKTKRLNEQLRRNRLRFPDDFAFRLTAGEFSALRSHFATSKKGRGGRQNLPFALTEHGVVMAANVLNSWRAVSVSVEVVRAFVRLRRLTASQDYLNGTLEELRHSLELRIDKTDVRLNDLVQTVESLVEKNDDDPGTRNSIGFL